MTKSLLLLVLCVLLLLVGCYVFYRYGWAKALSPERFHRVESSVAMPGRLLREIRQLGELHTASTSLQTIIKGEQRRWILWFVPTGKVRVLFIAICEVRAGVDLSGFSMQDIVMDVDRIQVVLPPAAILDVKLDVKQSEIYDLRKSVFLAPDSGRLFEQIQRQAVDQAREDALNSALLRTAEDKAQAILENMLAPLNRPVDVIFRE